MKRAAQHTFQIVVKAALAILFVIGIVSGASAAITTGSLATSITVVQGAPVVNQIIPSSGANTGTVTIQIIGLNFSGTTQVQLQNSLTPNSNLTFTVVSPTRIDATVPAGLIPAIYNVKVTNSVGTSADNHPGDQYTVTSGGGNAAPTVTAVIPSSGATTGTTFVIIRGTNLSGATAVVVGSTPVTTFQVITDQQINATVPAGIAPGIYDVRVTNAAAQSAINAPADQFTSTSGGGAAPPTITSVSPNSGNSNVATNVNITGTNFTGVTTLLVGSTSIPFQVQTDSTMTATVPAGLTPGPYFVTATNAVGTSPETPAAVFTVLDPNAGPFVTSVVPNSGANTGTTNVVINGFRFTNVTSVTIGGAAVQSFTVISPTQINAVIQAGLTPASYHIRVRNNIAISPETDRDLFTATSGGGQSPPTVTSVTPNSGSNVQPMGIIVRGTNFTGATSVKITGASGTLTLPFVVNNDGELSTTVPAGLTPAVYNLIVTNAAGSSVANAGSRYTVTPASPAPEIFAVIPNSGPNTSSTAVQVIGRNFVGVTTVTIGGVPVQSFTVVSNTQINAVVQAGLVPSAYHIQATSPLGTSTQTPGDIFTATSGGGNALPTVTAVIPNSGTNEFDVPVTIQGTNFTGTVAVQVDGTPMRSFTVVSDTEIHAVVPSGLTVGTHQVTVSNAVGTSATSLNSQYTVTDRTARPVVTAVSPNTSANTASTPITISGSNFLGATTVNLGATSLAFTVNSDFQITATVPAGLAPAQYNVTVTTPLGTSATNANAIFTVTGSNPPTVTNLNPNQAANSASTQVIVTGTNFTGANLVRLGVSSITFTVNSSAQITATVPAGVVPGVYDITVTSPQGTSAVSAASKFTVLAGSPPTVTAISPSTGPNNQTTPITITGTGFTGATSGQIGNTPLISFTVVNDGQATGTVPMNLAPGTYNISVTNGAGTSGVTPQSQFTVTAGGAAPQITSINPNNGPNNANTSIAISGTGFTGATSGAIGITPLSSFVVVSDVLVNGVVPSGLVPGTYNVSVTSPNGTSPGVSQSQFTVTSATGNQPIVTAVTPNTGANNAATPMAITGTNLGSPTAVNLGNLALAFTPINSGQVNATVPAGIAPGTYQVTVTTANGTSPAGPGTSFTVTNGGGGSDTQPPTTPDGITMVKSGNNLILGWTASTDNIGVTQYNIYRSTAANFVPTAATRVGTTPNVTTFTDTGVLADANSYFYRVTAQDAAGNESLVSNMGFKQRQVIAFHTNISNINWLSIPYRTPLANANAIAQDIPGVTKVVRLNPDTQQFESWENFFGTFSGTNFPVKAGEAYAVVVNADSVATLVGWHDSSVTISMTHHDNVSNINPVSIPYHATISVANDIVSQVGVNVTKVNRFNPATQQNESWELFFGTFSGTNFSVTPPEGHFIIINANTQWKPTTF